MTTDVACLFLTDDSWDSQTMVWDPTPEEEQNQGKTAPPEIDLDDAREIVTVGSGGVLAHKWCNWPAGAVAQEFYGDHVASAGLVSMCEGELCDGWAYFAKKEYNVDLGPRLYYGYGDAPVFPLAVFLDPPSVQGGNMVHGTVALNAPAPVEGTWVAISGDDCLVHVESGGTSVPQGSMTADFLVSTAIVSTDKNVTIEAQSNGLSATAQLEITRD